MLLAFVLAAQVQVTSCAVGRIPEHGRALYYLCGESGTLVAREWFIRHCATTTGAERIAAFCDVSPPVWDGQDAARPRSRAWPWVLVSLTAAAAASWIVLLTGSP